MRTNITKIFTALFFAAVFVLYLYVKPGLLPQYRWAGLVLGIVYTAVSTLVQFRKDRVTDLGLWYGILMLVIGFAFLFSRVGGVLEGFTGAAGVGVAAQEFYFHYKTRLAARRVL